MLRQLRAGADALFLDGLAPAKNPQMWSREIFAELARLAKPGATLATYTVAAAGCHGLTDAGFAVEKRAGVAHKRQMLCGRCAGPGADAVARADRRGIRVGPGVAC